MLRSVIKDDELIGMYRYVHVNVIIIFTLQSVFEFVISYFQYWARGIMMRRHSPVCLHLASSQRYIELLIRGPSMIMLWCITSWMNRNVSSKLWIILNQWYICNLAEAQQPLWSRKHIHTVGTDGDHTHLPTAERHTGPKSMGFTWGFYRQGRIWPVSVIIFRR